MDVVRASVEFRSSSFPEPCFQAAASSFTSNYDFTSTLRSHFPNAIFTLIFSRTASFLYVVHYIAMAALDVAGDPGAGWDEAQCTTALAQLEELQAQV
jgi:hypothetical protein